MDTLFQRVAPLSQERIIEALKRMDVVYHVDSAGDLGMFFNECVIWFDIAGTDEDVLMIHADPFRDIPMEEIMPFRKFINYWNATSFWPRVYPSINDDGIVRAHCDHAVNCINGITDAQLEANIVLFISMIRDFYTELDKKESMAGNE
ncbi:YbjN domain-containing protein [Arcanobacterium hippocoleae]